MRFVSLEGIWVAEDNLVEKISSALGGVAGRLSASPALLAVVVLIFAGAAFLAYSQFSTTAEFRVSVSSSSTPVEGALVEVLSSDGKKIAQGITTAQGTVLFKQKLPASGKVSLRVSKDGFLSADGSSATIVSVDLGKRKAASLELFASEVAGGDFSQGISFSVLDKFTRQPVSGASIDASVAGKQVLASSDAQGKAFVSAQKGDLIVVKVSAPNYYSDSRAYTAIRSQEEILLSPRLTGGFSFTSGELPTFANNSNVSISDSVLQDAISGEESLSFSMPQATVQVLDDTGGLVQSGTVSVVSESGQVIAQANVVNGVANLSGLPLSQGFSLQVSGTQSGSVSIFDPATNLQILSSSINNGVAFLSTTSSLSSLAVNVHTASGTLVGSGIVTAFDNATGQLLGQAQLLNGLAVLSSISPNTPILLTLSAAGFSASPVAVVFGKSASATIVASPVSPTQIKQTSFKAFNDDNSPASFHLRVFTQSGLQAGSPPVFDGDVASSSSPQVLQLAVGTYSAVFSAAGRYTATVPSLQAGSLVEVSLPSSSAAGTSQKCVTPEGGAKVCQSEAFSPSNLFSLSVTVSDKLGNAISNASVSLKDSQGRVVASQRSDSLGNAAFSSVANGSYSLVASYYGFYSSKSVTLASNLQQSIVLELKGTVFVSAQSMSGQPVSATFSVQGTGLSCSGAHCSLSVDANSDFALKASALGYTDAQATKRLTPGEILPVTFELVQAGALTGGGQVSFNGARDSLGRQAFSLLAGQDYFLQFSIAAPTADESVLAVRLGDASSVAQEDYGLLDFQPPAGADSIAKSTSFSPLPACVDLNNNNAIGGLFKWAQFSFSEHGAPLHKILSIPVRVKASASATSMKLYYRLAVRSGSTVLRIPRDDDLDTALDAPGKAGCYASSTSASIPIALTASCIDGTRAGVCSHNVPFACSASPSGALQLAPSSSCCPAGMIFSSVKGLCVLSSPPAGACADGTAQNQCSSINKPFLCTGGNLVAAVSCCPAGEIFGNGVCRPRGASCSIGSRFYDDGQCLPTAPGRCTNGIEGQDARACGCPQGTVFSESQSSCVAATCSDGTPAGQCSTVAGNLLKKCVLSSTAISASTSLEVSGDCSCPSGTHGEGGSCVACSTPDCGVPASVSCVVDGAIYSPGCILGNAPLYCNSGGSVSQNAVACGCPAGKQFNSASGTCSNNFVAACTDGTVSGACSTTIPKQCVALGGSLFLIQNALECGCQSGMVSNGVECRAAQALPTPQPGSTATPVPTATATPAPNQQASVAQLFQFNSCSTPNRCLSPDSSDEYCNAQGLVARSCLLCNQNCGGSDFLTCNPSTGTCDSRKCVDPVPFGTAVGQCVSSGAPSRCALVGGVVTRVQDSASCGCPAGQKPDASGQGCVPCLGDSCAGELAIACVDSQGNGYAAGRCLPDSSSNIFAQGAEPLKKCLAGGSIISSLVDCGCPTGFKRDFDSRACVRELSPSAPLDAALNLTPAITCPNCVASDDIFFDASDGASGKLKTQSGSTTYAMVADTVYPADAFSLNIQRASSPGRRISVQAISSSSGTSPCYSYDENTGVFQFRLGNACPIEVRANKFFHTGTGQEITSDQVSVTVRLESVPPQDLQLRIHLSLNPAESLRLQPQSLSGPNTPELVYLINNKQTMFGPRTLSIEASSTETNELPGAGVKVLAWRGPGTISVSEKSESVGSLTYSSTASYFTCTGGVGKRIDSCGSDPFCCAGGWCNPSAFRVMFANFKTYSKNLAAKTAFRRGIDSQGKSQPFATISGNTPFEVYTAAGVVDGAPTIISDSGIDVRLSSDCSSTDRPGVFQIKSSTTDGRNFAYNAQTAFLHKFDYVDGVCPDNSLFVGDSLLARSDESAMPLCDFLFGADCSCLQRSAHSNLLTATQNGVGRANPSILPLLLGLLPLLLQLGQLGKQLDGQNACGTGSGGSGNGKRTGGKNTGCPNGNCGVTQSGCADGSCSSASMAALPAVKTSLSNFAMKYSSLNLRGGLPVGSLAPPDAATTVLDLDAKGTGNFDAVASLEPDVTGGGPATSLCKEVGGKNINNLINGPLDGKFTPEEFDKQCTDKAKTYEQKRKETDEKCAGVPAPQSKRAGKILKWVMPPKDIQESSYNGECFLGFDVELCYPQADFTLGEPNRNDGSIVDELDKCEDEGGYQSGPEAGGTSPTAKALLSKNCLSSVLSKLEQVRTKVSDHIVQKVKDCRTKCAAQICGTNCVSGYSECVAACTDYGAQANQELEKNLDACDKAVEAELKAGDSCEDLAVYLPEKVPSIVAPEPKERKAYGTCYAFGNTLGGGTAAAAGQGTCKPVCQQMQSFVLLGVSGTGNDQLTQVNRYGVGDKPDRGECKDRPPSRAGELAGKSANDIENTCAQSRFQPQPIPNPQKPKIKMEGCTTCPHLKEDTIKIRTELEKNYEVDFKEAAGSPALVYKPGGGANDFWQLGGKGVTTPNLFIAEIQKSVPIPSSITPGVARPIVGVNSVSLRASTLNFESATSTGTPFDLPRSQGTGLLCVLDNLALTGAAGTPTAIPKKVSWEELKKQAERDKDDPAQTQPFINAHTSVQNFQNNKIPKAIRDKFGNTPPGQNGINPNERKFNGVGGNGGGGGGGGQQNPQAMNQMMQSLLPALAQMMAMMAMQAPQGKNGNAQLGAACAKGEDCKSGLCLVSKDPTGKDTTLHGYCTVICPNKASQVAASSKPAAQQRSSAYPQQPLGYNQQYPYGSNQYPYGNPYGNPYAPNPYPYGGGFNQPLIPIVQQPLEQVASFSFQSATPSPSTAASATPAVSSALSTQQQSAQTLDQLKEGCPQINGKLTICCTDCGDKPVCTIA